MDFRQVKNNHRLEPGADKRFAYNDIVVGEEACPFSCQYVRGLENRTVGTTQSGKLYFDLLQRAWPKLEHSFIFMDAKEYRMRLTTLSQLPPYFPRLPLFNADKIMRFLMWIGRHAKQDIACRTTMGVMSLERAIRFFLDNRWYTPTDCTKQATKERWYEATRRDFLQAIMMSDRVLLFWEYSGGYIKSPYEPDAFLCCSGQNLAVVNDWSLLGSPVEPSVLAANQLYHGTRRIAVRGMSRDGQIKPHFYHPGGVPRPVMMTYDQEYAVTFRDGNDCLVVFDMQAVERGQREERFEFLESLKVDTVIHTMALPFGEVVSKIEVVGKYERGRCTLYDKTQLSKTFVPLPFDENGDTIYEIHEHKVAFEAYRRKQQTELFRADSNYTLKDLRAELARLGLPSYAERQRGEGLAEAGAGSGAEGSSAALVPYSGGKGLQGRGSSAASASSSATSIVPLRPGEEPQGRGSSAAPASGSAASRQKSRSSRTKAQGNVHAEVIWSLRELGLVGRTPFRELEFNRTADPSKPYPCAPRGRVDSTTLGVIEFMEFARGCRRPIGSRSTARGAKSTAHRRGFTVSTASRRSRTKRSRS